ncbi:peptidoglycan -binding protein [Marivibrio halodurans]|uniref:Peptidoglycan -binding protein n=1 Tax=Marivibrio halodurans TaxID=2039722 RepID=A0A8J7V1E4_9PROT|nr:peptidoglycan -binding protein [Marivibrio halodurans]MBP5857716.1 peptidoglycan -binding protein [Marivibrio halodurans]
MALARRQRNNQDIWPGFVDALATLLMVIIFLLMIFVVSQLYLNEELIGRDRALDRLNSRIDELSSTLALEREANEDLRTNIERLSADLRASLAKRDALQAELSDLRSENTSLRADVAGAQGAVDKVAKELEDAYKVIEASQEKIGLQLQEIAALENRVESLRALEEELKNDLAQKDLTLDEEREKLVESQAEVALLNKRLKELNAQIASLNEVLEASEARDEAAQAQIADLGKRLNVALASKVQELARYRSEFFGRLREILGNRQDIQIVGDRFVFQSEVLFDQGSAELGTAGKFQLAQFARTLTEISTEIPDSIDWILRVDGHTDKVPIATARFPSNWELSTARAIEVVKYLIERGVPSDRLAATGFGDNQPLDPRDTPAAYQRNRRIEMKLDQL